MLTGCCHSGSQQSTQLVALTLPSSCNFKARLRAGHILEASCHFPGVAQFQPLYLWSLLSVISWDRQIWSHFLSLHKGLCRGIHSEAASIFFSIFFLKYGPLLEFVCHPCTEVMLISYHCNWSISAPEVSIAMKLLFGQTSTQILRLSLQNVVQRFWGPSVHGHISDSSPCCVGINSEELLFQP